MTAGWLLFALVTAACTPLPPQPEMRKAAPVASTPKTAPSPKAAPSPEGAPSPNAASAEAAPPQRPYGPLSTTGRIAETSWEERKKSMRRDEARMLAKQDIREDLALLSRVVDLAFVPRTKEQRAGMEILRQSAATLPELAPYSVESTLDAIRHPSGRIAYCARMPDQMWPCDPDFKPRPPADPTLPPYEVSASPSGIGRVTIRDLSDATKPAWAKLENDLAQLSGAAGIVLDLREAWGADPRPLLPWLTRLTGRAPMTPLREIRRSPQLTPYVDAYRARFVAEGRDPAVWASLVGEEPATAPRKTIPIAVVIGRYCQSACELVTRVLETYMDATVIGSAPRTGRLDRDEPAVLTLPRSRIDIYFHAAEYLLSKEIEAKTGPTSEWRASYGEPLDFDGAALAVRELGRRIAQPGWPKSCSAHPGYRTIASIPKDALAKIHNAMYLSDTSCEPVRRSVWIKADVSLHTMQRLVASCPARSHVHMRAAGSFGFGTVVGIELLSKLAQSDVVEGIYLGCSGRMQPNGQ